MKKDIRISNNKLIFLVVKYNQYIARIGEFTPTNHMINIMINSIFFKSKEVIRFPNFFYIINKMVTSQHLRLYSIIVPHILNLIL